MGYSPSVTGLRVQGLPRLGFASRLIVLVLLLLLAVSGLIGGFTFFNRYADPAARFPLADQIAAIHTVLDRLPAAERPLMLRAINSGDLSIRIVAAKPDMVPRGQRLPAVEWLVEQYLDKVGAHDVYATLGHARLTWIGQLTARFSPASQEGLSIAVSLSAGEYMLVGVKGSPMARFFGIPVGFWFGGLGALIAAVVMLAIIREARPIEALAASVSGFARDARPRPVAAVGAPEIRTLITATNDMQHSIAALLKGRTVLLGAISHDLRTYLTRLRLRVEAIDDATQRDKAVGDIEDMGQMIDSALAVARGAIAPDRRELVDLARLVSQDVMERGAAGAAITLDVPSEPAVVSGDPVALKRTVANIIDNSMRYGRGEVAISLAHVGAGLRLSVDDNGPGIPEDERHAVFEPFYRADASRNRATGGHGLGLAIVRDIVEAHGGSISVGSSPLGGARITLTLPAIAPSDQ